MNTPKLSVSAVLLIILFVFSALGALFIFYVIKTPVIIYPPVDKYIEYRRTFIHSGLFIAAAGFIILLYSVFKKNYLRKDKLLNYFLFVLIFAIAWKNYPYWANGLHHVFSNGTSSMYDPKDILPYSEIGIIWSASVLMYHILIWIIIPFPVVLWILDIKNNGFTLKDYLIIVVLLLIAASFYITPNYMYWFLD